MVARSKSTIEIHGTAQKEERKEGWNYLIERSNESKISFRRSH